MTGRHIVMVNADATDLLQGQLLRKKTKKNTWREYWVVLREDRLVFISENESKIAGIITLTEETTCKVLGRKSSCQHSATDHRQKLISERKQDNDDGTCKFKLHAKRGVHLLKTDCKSSCDKWIEAISRAVQNIWDNSTSSAGSTLRIKKHRFSKHGLQRDKNSNFSYTSLSEEDVDQLQRNSGKASRIQRAILTRFSLSRGKFGKWINFPSDIVSRGRSAVMNYGVLLEDTTD